MHDAAEKPINEQSLNEGWEVTDMKVGLVTVAFSGIGIMMFGACLIIILVMRGFDETRPATSSIEPSPVYTVAPVVEGYEGPLMQQDPRAGRDAYRAEAFKKLHSYEITIPDAGAERARIPIEEAMKQIASGEAPYKREAQTALIN